MFPRLGKITRFLVFIFTTIFLLSSYVYIFSSSADHAPYGVTQLELRGKMAANIRSTLFTNHNSDPMTRGQHGSDSDDYTDEENSHNAKQFQNFVHDKFVNSEFFRQRKQRCMESKSVTTENFSQIYSDLQISTSSSKRVYVNPHDFSYIHNPAHLCNRNGLSFLIYIHSSPVNLKKRQAIRQSWGNIKLLSLFNATLVFILGATPDKDTQNLVDMEANRYGDIVQENFIDAYRNLTYKGMTALKWAARFCNCAAFVFKADDDILLDVVSVIDSLLTRVIPSHGAEKLVLCNLWTRMRAMRNKKSKWYLSEEEFPHDTFPPYCSGSFFVLSSDIIPTMYNAALNSKFFWVDDYFITGVLVNSLQIKHVAFNQVYLLNYNVVEERLRDDRMEYFVFHIRQLSLFQRMWPLIVKRYQGMKSFLRISFKPFSRTIFNSTNHLSILNETVGNFTASTKSEIMTSTTQLLTRVNSTQKALASRYSIA